MSEKQQKINDAPLWIYSGNRYPDIVSFVLVILSLFVMPGLFSSNPGVLVRPFATLLRYWFGNGALLLTLGMLYLGITIFVMRWFFPRVRIRHRTLRLKSLLTVAVFLTLCGLFASKGSGGKGGSVGTFIYVMLSPFGARFLARFLLWAGLLAELFFLFDLKRFVPPLMDRLRALMSALFPHPDPRHRDRDGFDWAREFRAQNLAASIRERSVPIPETDDDWDDPAESAPPEEPPTEEPPAELRPDWVQMTAQLRELTEKSAGLNPSENEYGEIKLDRGENDLDSEMLRNARTNQLPPLNLLEPELGFYGQNTDHQEFIRQIEEAMDEFGTPVHVIGCEIGPSVIQYQVVPGKAGTEEGKGKRGRNIRVSQVAQMERDLAVRMGNSNLSVQAPVPGESYIGIDIPNPNAMKVRLRPLIESPEFTQKGSPLNVVLGRNITGRPVVVDLAGMPHLLVAGTTNSGKSICLRAMAICLAMNNTPDELRMVMIDPKRVELFRFNGLPHLLGKVETEYERSIAVLEWAVQEMTNRYKLFESTGSHNIGIHNRYAEAHGMKKLPYIVIFIDEMAEIMKGSDKQGEVCIDKLASLARAAGMHLVMATQRPDTSIITGKIKTNIPARIALNVASAVDSRVIMGKPGAEKLLGRGDMYFIDPSLNVPTRVQGALLTDHEIDRVVNLWKKLWPADRAERLSPWEEILESGKQNERSRDDKKLREAVRLVCRTKKASAAYLSGRLSISFPTASRLLSRMEEMGVVGPMQLGGRAREVLWDEEEGNTYYAETKSRRSEESYDDEPF